jgi:hypothetical protein
MKILNQLHVRSTRSLFCSISFAIAVVLAAVQFNFAQSSFPISAASFLGDASNTDRVRGGRILSDGTIVLAANIGASNPGGVAPVLLGNATASSSGAVLRMSADGRTVLSVTRLAAQVEDLAIDANNNIYVAAWNDGLFKLNSTANAIVWSKTGRTLRVDAGGNGTVASLVTTTTNPDAGDPGAGTINVYDAAGTSLGSFAGKNNTLDVCVDTASQTVVSIGWRQATAFDGSSSQPVQIAYLRGSAYDGTIKYTIYDWSTDTASPRFINRPTNNMADTRGYRCTIGADGKLYAAFEVAGGNHIFRYSPTDIMTTVSIVGGDQWHAFYNTRSEHKTFFARYEPGTGAYLRGQQLLTRLSNGNGNAMRVNSGAITADAQGRVYIGGASAYGLPMPPHSRYTAKPSEITFNPFPAGYIGGAWFMVLSADLSTRLYTTRLASDGSTHAVDARTINGATKIFFGGTTTSTTETYTHNAIQTTMGGTQEGWFGVINSGAAAAAVKKPFDFDNDGKSDVSVFRPSSGVWHISNSTAGYRGVQFGVSGDKLVPEDYDGDNKTDIAVVRGGVWYILNSANNTVRSAAFGFSTDIPAPADFDGDNKADIAVFRPSAGAWYMTLSSNNAFNAVSFGTNGDIPVANNYDGDTKADVAVFRPSTGSWFILQSSNNTPRGVAFGQNGDKPVVGDYDGDTKADIAVFRAGNWYVLLSSNGSFRGGAFGTATDKPTPGDFDGDGKTDYAVYRLGNWYFLNSSNNAFRSEAFGAAEDLAVPSAYIP